MSGAEELWLKRYTPSEVYESSETSLTYEEKVEIGEARWELENER